MKSIILLVLGRDPCIFLRSVRVHALLVVPCTIRSMWLIAFPDLWDFRKWLTGTKYPRLDKTRISLLLVRGMLVHREPSPMSMSYNNGFRVWVHHVGLIGLAASKSRASKMLRPVKLSFLSGRPNSRLMWGIITWLAACPISLLDDALL